jgi:hypothetical protein
MLVRKLFGHGIRRFLCTSDVFPVLLKSVDGALAVTSSAIYRVDALTADAPPTCRADESIAVLHAGRLIAAALRLEIGRSIAHLITSDTPQLDVERRRPLELDGVPYYPIPDLWTPEN